MIKNIIFGVLTLGLLGSILFLNIPTVEGVLATRKEIQSQQGQLNQTTDFIRIVEKLMEKYNDNQKVLQKLDSILPNNQDIPNLLVQIEALANDGGVVLKDVVITASSEDKTTSKAQEIRTGDVSQEKIPTDYKSININLKLTTSYESFKNFLKTIENNLRLVDIDSISFSSQAKDNTKEGGNTFDFDIMLKTYYQVKQ